MTPDPSPEAEVPVEQLVPVWLAALVVVLVLALAALAGFIARGLLTEQRYASPEQLEIEMRLAEVAADRENPRTRLALGYAYQQAGRWEEALAEYETVLDLFPNDTAALYNSALIRFELDEPELAEETLWEVLRINPRHVLAAKTIGEHFAEQEEYRSLLAAVAPAAEGNESSADLQYLVGLAHENLGRADLAEEYFRRALKYYPDMVEAREGLGRLGVEP